MRSLKQTLMCLLALASCSFNQPGKKQEDTAGTLWFRNIKIRELQ